LNDASSNPSAHDWAAVVLGTADAPARKRVERAATDGDTDAMNYLGLAAIRDGDSRGAIKWWHRSAAEGDRVAPALLRRVQRP
jgi:hypothetical protein